MIAAIENAILARLKDARELLGYAFRETISQPLETDEATAERAQQFPAAWTVFAGYKPVSVKGDDAKVRATFYVVVAAQHLGNESARRLGVGESQPGAYQLAEDVVGLLLGQTLGLPIEPFKLGELVSLQSSLKAKRGVALFGQAFTTDFIIEARPPADLEDFDVLHVNWDIPAFGGVDADPATAGVQLPADATADATSHIRLSEEP